MPTLKKSKTKSAAPKAAFNHAMIYSTDVERSLAFYQGALGFRLIETFKGGPRVVYARLQAPAGKTTIALHQAGADDSVASPGIRLYFEVKQLDAVCEKLKARGIEIKQMPKPMPWGWTHAYLDDPDGHEVSLYWAGAKRFRKTDPGAMKRAAAAPR